VISIKGLLPDGLIITAVVLFSITRMLSDAVLLLQAIFVCLNLRNVYKCGGNNRRLAILNKLNRPEVKILVAFVVF
jgi:hypothetical protein